MIAWFVENKVAANLLMISILLGGLVSLNTTIPLEVFPSFDMDRITVDVSLRGATPEDVEKGVAIKIEEAVQDLEGIKHIISVSSEGQAKVTIEVESSANPRDLLADIKSRVDAINTLPADAEKPVIALMKNQKDVITVTIASDYSEKELRQFAEKVRDDLLALKGVTQVELDAVRNYQINIHVPSSMLEKYDLTLANISDAINLSSLDMSAGNIKTQGGDILVRSKGQAYDKAAFGDVLIKTQADGTFLHLRDIATIDDGFEEEPINARFNGQQAALLEVYRVGNQSAIDVANAVKTYIDKQQPLLPAGFSLSYWDDDSVVVKSRLNTLINNALQGGLLVFLLLALFLRPSIAFWVFIGIPVSFLGAFIVMPLLGISINILSLFGFILVLGIVVDDAIVTGENIYRHTQTASTGKQAAIEGANEVALPVTFGVLTTVAAFLPLAFIEGARGVLFLQIPAIVIPVLLFSLIESKFVLPAHLSQLKLRSEEGKPSTINELQQRFADGFEHAIIRYYKPVLNVAVNHRGLTVALFMGVFIVILALVMSGWMRFVFMPKVQSETAKAEVTMPAGTSFIVVDHAVEIMQDAALALKEKYQDEKGNSLIQHILTVTSGQKGRVRFEILPADKNDTGVTTKQLVKEWRALVGDIPGAESVTYRAEIGRGSDPINVELSGVDLEVLQKIADKVKLKLATFPGIFDIADSLSSGKQEVQIDINAQGHAMGMSNSYITRQVRNAFFGADVQRIQRGRQDVRVMVMLPKEERMSMNQLNDLLIETPTGEKVPLSHVAKLTTTKSPSAIYRYDRFRTVNVTADIDKEAVNMTRVNAELKTYLDDLLVHYPAVVYDLAGEAEEQSESFGSLQAGLIIVFFIIYCLLAIPFQSYIQPIIVMSVIPFGFIGAVIGHWIMGMDLTIMSMMGLMALVGVVVNDSLVLVDYINKKRKACGDLMEAVLTAGTLRFRPVLLTSLTTFIGLMPLLFEKSTQAQFLIPMAVSLGFGILFATFITLILVPVNYLLVEDVRGLFRSSHKTN